MGELLVITEVIYTSPDTGYTYLGYPGYICVYNLQVNYQFKKNGGCFGMMMDDDKNPVYSEKKWCFVAATHPPLEIAGVPYDQGLLTIGFP